MTNNNDYSQTSNGHQAYAINSPYNSHLYFHDYCTCCTQSSYPLKNQLLIETNVKSVSQLNHDYRQRQNQITSLDIEHYQNHNSVIIITTHMYSNSPFISYIYNCLSNHFHPKIVSIDYLTNYHHPNTFKIFYLICFDRFDSIMKQILDSTILNNLNTHVNYLFLIINAPSYEIVKHFYSTIIDKQTILILHYHLTFDNEPLLLCSGNRKTFEIIQPSLLKYLCSKIKYIQSIENNQQQEIYSSDSLVFISQSNNTQNTSIIPYPSQSLELDSFQNYQNNTSECSSVSTAIGHSQKLNRQRILNNSEKKIFKSRYKKHLQQHENLLTSSSQYCVQNILDNFNFSE